MKKLITILLIFASVGVMAQTPSDLYAPKILEQNFTYDNGDNGLRQVYMTQKNLDGKNWILNYSMVEYRNSIRADEQCWKKAVSLLQTDTITDVLHNGNYYTNTAFWFSKQVITIELPLFVSFGTNMYYKRVDPDSLFINLSTGGDGENNIGGGDDR